MAMSRQTLAKLAAAYAGAVFGIYWIPVRALEDAGFPGIWAAVVFNTVPLILVLPLLARNWRAFAGGGLRFHAGAVLAGLTLSGYAVSVLYTDVLRAVLLFYLTPVWGFLIGWAVLGERMTWARWGAIALGLAGMAVIFGGEGLPLPRNAGDWLALAAGMFWAVASAMMLTDRDGSALTYGLGFFGYATLSVWGLALVLPVPAPDWSALPEVLPWMAPVAALIVIPGGFATVYGPRVLNPGTVGLLFMTEITVATVTAGLLTDEPLGAREITGVVLITLAGLAEALPARPPRRLANDRPSP